MYKEIAERIVNASRRNTLTFFVGAGISRCSNLPGWKKLIVDICKKLDRKYDEKIEKDEADFSSEEYLSIPQMLSLSLSNEEEYASFIRSEIDKPDAVPNEIHRLLLEFKPTSFLTTNYDTLLEQAAVRFCQPFICVAEDKEVPLINGNRFILKVHGDFEHKNFVLKEEDYLGYEENYKLIATLMRSVFATNTVVFIGYRLGDYNVKLIMDWVRRILKDRFKAIFLRVEDNPLPKEEKRYYEKRGLDVVELYYILTEEERKHFPKNYTERYGKMLNHLKRMANPIAVEEDENKGFMLLGKKIGAFDKLKTLRRDDVQKALEGWCIVEIDGSIRVLDQSENGFALYAKYCEMNADVRKSISKQELDLFWMITRVFNKAEIRKLVLGKSTVGIPQRDYDSFENLCLSFDYSGMERHAQKEFSTLDGNFKKAFYLTNLLEYEKAYDLFVSIAREAFKNKEYLCFYLAQVNCALLRKVIAHPQYQFYRKKGRKKSDSTVILYDDKDEIFDNLPQEFKSVYYPFKDLATSEFLFRNGFETAVDAKNLSNTVANGTFEWGYTSSDRALRKVKENLSFLLGNGIRLDLFNEYRSSMRDVMEMLVLKYADQQRASSWSKANQSEVVFDHYNYYCLVSFFSARQIVEMFKKCDCNSISFSDIRIIESSIKNLLNYCEKLDGKEKDQIEHFFSQMSSCLALCRYMDISEETVEYICKHIFKPCNNRIPLDEKVLFIDAQVYSKGKTNPRIQKTLETVLLKYLDERIESIEGGSKWSSLSRDSTIDYAHLCLYIAPKGERKVSRKLTERIRKIIDKRIEELQQETTYFYAEFISKTQRKKLINWIEEELKEKFRFSKFKLLVGLNTFVAKKHSPLLHKYLLDKVSKEIENRQLRVGTNLESSFQDELLSVGYWCLIGALKRNDFLELKGIDPRLDFYLDSSKFDFNKFEVSWLLELSHRTIKNIVKRPLIRKKIVEITLLELKRNNLKQRDRNRLIEILSKDLSG